MKGLIVACTAICFAAQPSWAGLVNDGLLSVQGGSIFASTAGSSLKSDDFAHPEGIYTDGTHDIEFSCNRTICTGRYVGDEEGAVYGFYSPQTGQFVGHWSEMEGDHACESYLSQARMMATQHWGRIDFRFDATADTWTGTWDYCGDGPNPQGNMDEVMDFVADPAGDWNGQRAD